ncbi:MAG: hypothetical protein GY928_00900 [Colwellia sp.]|nr:hypothetical protein [Colwellia sp.]
MLDDRIDTDTFECRNSLRLYRAEAGNTVRKVLDNRMDKAILSGRVEVGLNNNSNVIHTHNYRKVRI